jgi:hypothetical protein
MTRIERMLRLIIREICEIRVQKKSEVDAEAVGDGHADDSRVVCGVAIAAT